MVDDTQVRETSEDDPRHHALLQVTTDPEACLQALMRTGLVTIRAHYIGDLGPGTHNYLITPAMHEILQYTDFIIEDELNE